MRRLGIFILLMVLSGYGYAQTAQQILGSKEYLWAEGKNANPSTADDLAVEGLMRKLAATDILPLAPQLRQEVWKTYRKDIRACSHAVSTASGDILRYIAWRDVDQLFRSRWRKVRELVDFAEKSVGQPDQARTYARWAGIYLESLPPGEQALRSRLARLQTSLGGGRTDAVRMRNIESEVEAIQRALLSVPVPVHEVAVTPAAPSPKPSVEAVVEQQEPVRSRYAVPPPVMTSRPLLARLSVRLPMDLKLRARQEPPRLPWKWSLLLSADVCSTPALGVAGVWQGGKWGVYLSSRSHFVSGRSDYDCSSDGTTPYGRIWTSGEVRKSRFVVSAGPVLRISGPWSLYAGVGYGRQSLLWEDTDGRWARVADRSSEGLLLEGGVLLGMGHWKVGLGVSEIAFSSAGAMLMAGWTF